MRLVCCGTGAGPFSIQRASSGYLLQHDGSTLMLDCGPGSLRNALHAGVETRDIDAIVLSHLHLDHMLDLTCAAFQSWYHSYWRAPAVIGPPGTEEAVRPLISFKPPNDRALPFGTVIEVEGSDEREIAGFLVRSAETPHSANLRAYSRRFSTPEGSLVFSGDTRPNPDLMASLAVHANVLLHECFSQDALERYAAGRPPEVRDRMLSTFHETHSEVEEVALIAQDVGARCLVLTHILPTEDDATLEKLARRHFRGELVVAHDGLVIDI